MTTLYVDARNGNDTASGTTWAAALKTLGAAETAINDGGTINAAGVFNESVTLNFAKSVAFVAVGYAVLDGTASIADALAQAGSTNGKTISFSGFRITNYTTRILNSNTFAPNLNFANCVFDTIPVGFNWSAANAPAFSATNCLFDGFTTYAVYNHGAVSCTLLNCTFVNCGKALMGNTSFVVNKCIFRSNTYHTYLEGGTYTGNSNDYDFSAGKCYQGGADKTSLSAWKAVVGVNDSLSLSVDPLFLDAAKGIYLLQRTSPAILGGAILGAYSAKLGYGISNNVNATLWTGATVNPASGAALNGSNNWTLASGSSATVTFETADFGTPKNIRKINLLHAYAGLGAGTGGGPSGILDYDKADTLPETWEYRVAVSTDGATYGAFADKNYLTDLNLTNVRRLKIEVTLRDDA
jgi:hypothetical protein